MIWPDDERQDVEELMRERLGDLIPATATIGFLGETRGEQSRAALTLGNLKDDAQLTIEVVVDRKAAGVDEEEGKCLALDAMDNLAFEWLDSPIPPRVNGSWQKREFQGVVLDVRLQLSFPLLDAAADEILKGGGN